MQAYSLVADIITACWIVFVTVWLLAALSTKRAIHRETRAQRLRYWVLFVIACFLLLYRRELPYPLNVDIVPRATPIACGAALFCVAGLAFAIWARATLAIDSFHNRVFDCLRTEGNRRERAQVDLQDW